MVAQGNNQNDDFFNLLEKDQALNDPFAAQEIVFRDASGKLRVLKEGQVLEFAEDQSPPPIVTNNNAILPRPVSPPKPSASVKPTVPVASSVPPVDKNSDIDQEVKKVIAESRIKFNDAQTEKKFISIVRSRLKGIRNTVQTKEAFISSMVEGGMGFDSQTADRIISILNKHLTNFNDKLRDEVSAKPFVDLQAEVDGMLGGKSGDDESPSLIFQQDLNPKDEPTAAEDFSLEVPPAVEKVPPKPKQSEVSKFFDEPNSLKIPVKKPVLAQINLPKPITGPDPSKPRIEDVKFAPRLTGPIEEIRTMTLTDFRKLAPTPLQAIEKIIEKIDLLEDEAFVLKTQGIKAWKESPINRLYIELGDDSMENRRSISEIIMDRQENNIPTLTEDEIDAVIELNKRLRY